MDSGWGGRQNEGMCSEESTAIRMARLLGSELFEDELATKAGVRETNKACDCRDIDLRKRNSDWKRPRSQPYDGSKPAGGEPRGIRPDWRFNLQNN
jgi:hypothetical protein